MNLFLIFLINLLCSTFVSIKCFSQKTDTALVKWGYFTSPVYTVYSDALRLNKNWTVGTNDPNNPITQMGAWINPKGTGITFLTSILFGEFNIKALEKNYETNLRNLILGTNKKLPNDVGQIIRCEYYYNDQNIADVNSVRFMIMGVGTSPEESYAEGPIDQIDSRYTPSSAFPKRNEHLIWMYKNKNGDIEIETIREPFLASFKERSLKIKADKLKSEGYFPMFNDANLKNVAIAEKSISIAKKYEEHLTDLKFFSQVNNLNTKLTAKQDELNTLINDYNKAISQQNKSSSLLQLIDLVSTVNSSFNAIGASASQQNTGIYKTEVEYLKSITDNTSQKIKSAKKDLNNIKTQVESIFKRANIPDRLPPLQ